MPTPPVSTNPAGGIFQHVLKIEGPDPARVAAAGALMSKVNPYAAAIYQALNVLPEGDLKRWLTAGPIDFWKNIYTAIFGKKYTSGDYILAERLNDQVYGNPNIDRGQASNQMVDLAHVIFNQLFGVRISTEDDLSSLDHGVTAYKQREASQGMSDNAIERAVYLKQHFYPASTYNVRAWDLRYFEMYPLVDKIPGYELGKWYTGEVIGGAYAVDGLIPVSADDILDQYVGSEFDPVTGTTTTPDGTVISPTTDGAGLSAGGASGNLLDKVAAYVKTADPVQLLAIGAALVYAYTEIEDEW